MRFAGIEKMGYYPTPLNVVGAIAEWLRAPDEPYRVLDPCCGEGEAVSELVSRLGGRAETWGVELSPVRAGKARERLTQVLQGDWFSVQTTEKGISVLWLNPPYDHDAGGEHRMEISFLRSTLDVLVPGGVLVYIIPQHVLGYEMCARTLLGYFEHLVIRRFPDGEFERFRQVVVLGVRRARYQKPDGDSVNALRALADTDLPVLEIPQFPWPVSVPPAPQRAKIVLTALSNYERVCKANQMGWPRDLLDALDSSGDVAEILPAMPLKRGHVAMLMSSGLMGTLRLRKPDGRSLLIKGRVVKRVEQREEETAKGEKVVVQRDKFVTTIGLAESSGVQIVDDVEGVVRIMEEWGEEIARAIMAHPPLYNLDPQPEEWATVSALGKNREPLAGQDEPGLLDVQAHAAIALARVARKYGHALIQGAMGTGKTTISLATVELLGEYPVLVMCPPHLVAKWCREVQEVVPGAAAVEVRTLGELQQVIAGYRAGRLPRKMFVVIASTTAKLGSGWKGAAAIRYRIGERRERLEWHLALNRYKKEREKLLEMKKAGQDTADQQARVEQARKEALGRAVQYPVCPGCGCAFTDREGHLVTDFKELDRQPLQCPECGTPLYDFGRGRFRRWPLAEYIAAKADGFFRVLIADEVHEYKGKDSDRGLAFHKLVGATKYQLALTGTFFGGKSSSIFWLMHRLRMGGVQRDFGYTDEMRWARRYGVLETRFYGKGDPDDIYSAGRFTANARRRVTVSEKPGISPAILERILPTTVFLSLSDLGVALPPYGEEVTLMEMGEEQRRQYFQMDDALKHMAVTDKRFLSLWLQWSLARPNSGFRDEVVIKELRNEDGEIVNRETLLSLPRVVVDGELLPKESWLASFAAAEVQAGRKVLVYVRQTASRDIQPRLKEVLEQSGLRVGILYSSVDTRKREEWIQRRVPEMDVLIVNPGIVATGLDLIQFATIVYYEIEYSLYTMWQAMSRVWRLRQKLPVKVVFTSYTKAMEEAALALQGRKMKAAQLLYGQQVEGAIVPEEDDNLLLELAQTILEEKQLPDLQVLFAVKRAETLSPLGCPTARSPLIVSSSPSWEELQAMALATPRKRRKSVVAQGQMMLPGFAA
jgi:SAM-dependent methyltransferase